MSKPDGSKRVEARVMQALTDRRLLPSYTLTQDGFVAVRLTEGREWLDLGTFE